MDNLLLFDQLNSIINNQNRTEEEFAKIKSAFDFAYKLHEGQYRRSEDPYILHPLEVACILADLKADTDTICAALLHDILEDTDTQPEEISEKFGEDVLTLVNGVTKLSKFSFSSKEQRQAENFRKMFLAMADDIRIIFVKLADRLHNMRTLNYMKPEKQKEIAKETIEIFAPLANRLGMGLIKSELEDLSLRYINPEKYFEIAQLVAQAKAEREMIVEAIIDKITNNLQNMHIDATITGRAKSYYSIYSKMKRQQKTYQDLYDVTAIRIIVDSEKECYEVLGLIHSAFKPIPGRFKDFIAMPKNNLYRSLHTSVIGPRGKPIEVQIRTTEMHEVSEFGIAAHWKYKEAGRSSRMTSEEEQKFSWLRNLIEFQQDIKDAKEYVDIVKLDLFSDQVFVFTPKGDVIDLPADATPLDVAYRIHTEVGHRCTGALVNGKIVTLDTKLNNGDIVEILTGKKEMPRLDWINIVATNQARTRIRLWFKKNLREEHITRGKDNLEHELSKSVFNELMKEGEILDIAKQLNYHAEDDLFAALGYGEISLTKITNRLKVNEVTPQIKISKPSAKKSTRIIEGLEDMLHHISKCCSPVPGEPIIGVVTKSRGVSVHREDCKSLKTVNPNRLLQIGWNLNNAKRAYTTKIFVEVIDRMGVFKDVLGKVSDNKINITDAKIKRKNKNFVIIEVGLEINDINQLNQIIKEISSVSDVITVKRQQSGIAAIRLR